jgi:hypothetical protein
MSDGIKVVIAHKDNKGSIGVQSPDCDPIFRTFEGDLGSGLERVPGIVEEARQLWESSPQFPKCETPLPSQAVPAQAPRQAVKPTKTSRQTPMF